MKRLSPKDALKKVADDAREMHRRYPFTKTVSSAWFRKKRGG